MNNYLAVLENGTSLAVTIDPTKDTETVSKAMTAKPAGSILFGHESGMPVVIELKQIVALYPIQRQGQPLQTVEPPSPYKYEIVPQLDQDGGE